MACLSNLLLVHQKLTFKVISKDSQQQQKPSGSTEYTASCDYTSDAAVWPPDSLAVFVVIKQCSFHPQWGRNTKESVEIKNAFKEILTLIYSQELYPSSEGSSQTPRL